MLIVKFQIIQRSIKKTYQKSHHPEISIVSILMNIVQLFLHAHVYTCTIFFFWLNWDQIISAIASHSSFHLTVCIDLHFHFNGCIINLNMLCK